MILRQAPSSLMTPIDVIKLKIKQFYLKIIMYQTTIAEFERNIQFIALKYNGLNVQAKEFVPSGDTYVLKNGKFYKI
jgi:hypothetical protein